MEETIKVTFKNGRTKEYRSGVTLYEVSRDFQEYFNYPILIGKINNEFYELSDKVTKNCEVDFLDRSSVVGNTVYARSIQFMLLLATKRILGTDVELFIEHSIDKGIYCEIAKDIDKPVITKIEKEMKKIVKENLIFIKLSVLRREAMEYFEKQNQMDKVKMLKYISNTSVNLYRLDDVYDYFHSDMAYSTSALDDFKLTYIKNNGFVLSYPNVSNPECTLDYVHRKKIFDVFLNYTNWGKMIGIQNAADLNEVVSKGEYDNLIQLSEAYYNNQLNEVANMISENKNNIKIVLIAGPSSSGKTTTAKKLEIYLQSKGLKTHQISVDDYFVNKIDTPKLENGDYDFESLRAVDVDLFNKHLTRLLEGERVLMPQYNFVSGQREYKKKYLEVKENDILIIEGIHCLNDDLTISIDAKNKFKIYINPFTQLNIDNHNRIHTSDTRRLRRIIRDSKYRGYGASETLKMWHKIREGEEKYIFPYQDSANVVINSAHVYELGVLKTYAEPLLFLVEPTDPVYPEALRLINFLRNFLPIPGDGVPKDSVLREFIGGSSYHE